MGLVEESVVHTFAMVDFAGRSPLADLSDALDAYDAEGWSLISTAVVGATQLFLFFQRKEEEDVRKSNGLRAA